MSRCPHCGGELSIDRAGGTPSTPPRRILLCTHCWSTWDAERRPLPPPPPTDEQRRKDLA